MYTRLLVPLDGSRMAEAVLPLVQRLAAAWQATVILLHILERDAPAAVHGDRHLRQVGEAESYLEELAAELRAQGIRVELHAHPSPEGDVARSVVQHSVEDQADLIVLSVHGRGRMRDILFGRIAQQVLRRGSAPVLLVHPEGVRDDIPEPRTVLVPLNGAGDAEAALAPATAFARVLEAGLHLVMVVPTPDTVRGDRQALSTLLPATTRAGLDLQTEEAQAYLAAVEERLRAAGSPLSVAADVCRGDIAAVLAAEAAESGVVLVAIATHGRAGLPALWASSVATQLLARTRAPILLLRNMDT